MDLIKVTKVERVRLLRGNARSIATLHLTTHHLIFVQPGEELWVCFPMIHCVELQPASNTIPHASLSIRCRNFVFLTLFFEQESDLRDVFLSIQKLTCINSVEQLYAFVYQPRPPFTYDQGWQIYDAAREFRRQGVDALESRWRITEVNRDYELCATYPHVLAVPAKISDRVIQYAAKFRSKKRFPVLSYIHRTNLATMTRSSQPMVGLKQNRSIQDEKLIESIFSMPTTAAATPPARNSNMIVDARPTTNAVVNMAVGAGTESVENYKNCRKEYMDIANIHVMRESLARLVDAVQEANMTDTINKQQLARSQWLKHIAHILDGCSSIIRTIHDDNAHALVHCSDGWDRTAQLTSISALCLDPYYRTLEGFAVLVEKEWVSFGHKFRDRCGHLSHERYFVSLSANAAANTFSSMHNRFLKSSHEHETSPVFQQFLDCVYQLWTQFPRRFEFNEDFLLKLHYHVYSCQFGSFLGNSERERNQVFKSPTRTHSVWSYFLSRRCSFTNPLYDAEADQSQTDGVLKPDTSYLKYWASLFWRHELKDVDLSERMSQLSVET
ncbi:phosphatidylinositol-3-phosphatase ymr1 [Dimargaris cristalligena]|uniref:Myotubularin-like phosphatase domain-containing protein n=1 Tax=Dimargaris cristalligena TaxID=215637 RepID=A0A4P9ZT34_9FUNG|nr:phosphatidylinositol-3-phosphatase ymr1 [Dimargaris cristalligena]RKP36663.1 Myotubularin-like phosphatase domain-containing protein [Dimargaris cristalligena]|eukprot:RKP36663.1 Myotubularin-like phosphatase domain-containing protein [Dimargaris cristalligena]